MKSIISTKKHDYPRSAENEPKMGKNDFFRNLLI